MKAASGSKSTIDGIRIGVIGSDVMVNKIAKVLKGFPSFDPVLVVSRHDMDVPLLAEDLMHEVEVILFGGPMPYRQAKERVRFSIPALHLPVTGTGLYRALFQLRKQRKFASLTVDTISRNHLESALAELGERELAINCYDGPHPFGKEALVAYHRAAYEAGGGGHCALTCIKSVAEELTARGIPNEWVVPTEQDIVVTLERALLSTETRRSNESQIVLGFLSLDDSGRLFERTETEHEVQKLKLDIHRMLLGYVETLDGHLTHLGGDEYLFITTRGIFERETGGYKYIPLAREAEKSFGLTLSVGIGFGRSAGEAGTHARLALRQAKEAGGNISFIVREDRSVIGPLEMSQPLEVNLSLLDSNLIKKAENTGMSLAYLSKLAAQVARKGRTDYTAQELATILGVTIRSVHRFLLQWMDTGLVSIVGEQRSQSKGRPKQVYRLLFIDDQNEASQ